MKSLIENNALTNKNVWEKYYRNKNFLKNINNFLNFYFLNREAVNIIDMFLPRNTRDKRLKLIEMGCANSDWLPYFFSKYNFYISGIDYLDEGCNLAEKKLKEIGCIGENYEIIRGDFFEVYKNISKKYDILFSSGVVEHFKEPYKVINTFINYLEKNSIIITLCPNTSGISMWLQKYIDKDIYNNHKRFTLEELIQQHKICGLNIVFADYVGFMSFNNLDFSNYGKIGLFIKGLIKIINIPIVYLFYLLKKMLKLNTYKSPFSLFFASMIVVAKRNLS